MSSFKPKFRSRHQALFLLCSLLTLAACSQQTSLNLRPGIDPSPEVQASKNILDSFSVQPELAAEGSRVVLSRTALEKEFLLHGSYIPQQGIPTSHGLQARVVAFRRFEDRVILLDASGGHTVTYELPTTRILAEIPIVSETESALVLDFNAGMKRAFVAGNWHASDSEKPGFRPDPETVHVLASYLSAVGLKGNRLEIRQSALIDTSDPEKSATMSVEFRYFLEPYSPSREFTPRETSDFRQVGYFEVAPRLEERTARVSTRIARWDAAKPVIYSISANTPAEYIEPIRQGILYWNKAFGREVLKVEVAPAGVTAPDAARNLVQWVPNDAGGSAYADALMDPRSGEIRHAQVYINSGLVASVRSRVPALLRRLRSQAEPVAPRVGLHFLSEVSLCDLDDRAHGASARAELAREYEALLESGADDAAIRKVSADYLRYVAAHEVGHTLGLRHNFAGSLGSTVNQSRRDELFLAYVQGGETPVNETFTTSVMEYAALSDSTLSSAQILASPEARVYDRLAIRWGYFGETIDEKTAPLFCTDSHAEKYKDCVRFDNGAAPIVSSSLKLAATLKGLPRTLAEAFIAAKAPADPRDRKDFSKVAIELKEYVDPVVEAVKEQLAWLQAEGAPSIAIERQFPHAGPLNQSAIAQSLQSWINTQVSAVGGVDAAAFSLLPASDRPAVSLAAESQAALAQYLGRAEVRSGTGYDGKPYVLTDEEVVLIRATGEKLFRQVEDKVVEKLLELLGSGKYSMTNHGEAIEERLGSVARAVLLAQTETALPGVDGSPSAVREFRYPRAVRAKAAKLLARSLGGLPDWSLAARLATAAELKALVEKSFGSEVGKIDPSRLTRAQRQWLMEQAEFVQMIQQTAMM